MNISNGQVNLDCSMKVKLGGKESKHCNGTLFESPL